MVLCQLREFLGIPIHPRQTNSDIKMIVISEVIAALT